MTTYTWRGRNQRGEAVHGQLEAETEAGVADQLVLLGVAPVHIAIAMSAVEASKDNWLTSLSRKPPSEEDVLVFSRQMYTLNKAGVPT